MEADARGVEQRHRGDGNAPTLRPPRAPARVPLPNVPVLALKKGRRRHGASVFRGARHGPQRADSQYFTLSTVRKVFEVATAGVVARWYFKKDGEGSIVRSMKAILAAQFTSFGTCCFGGLFQFVVDAVVNSYLRLKKIYDRTSWGMLPIKLSLLLSCWLVGSSPATSRSSPATP